MLEDGLEWLLFVSLQKERSRGKVGVEIISEDEGRLCPTSGA